MVRDGQWPQPESAIRAVTERRLTLNLEIRIPLTENKLWCPFKPLGSSMLELHSIPVISTNKLPLVLTSFVYQHQRDLTNTAISQKNRHLNLKVGRAVSENKRQATCLTHTFLKKKTQDNGPKMESLVLSLRLSNWDLISDLMSFNFSHKWNFKPIILELPGQHQ